MNNEEEQSMAEFHADVWIAEAMNGGSPSLYWIHFHNLEWANEADACNIKDTFSHSAVWAG